jgi:hypothetical protein
MNPANNGTPAIFVTASPGYCHDPTWTLNSSSPSPTRWKPEDHRDLPPRLQPDHPEQQRQCEAVDQQSVVPRDREVDVLREREAGEQREREQAGHHLQPAEPQKLQATEHDP